MREIAIVTVNVTKRGWLKNQQADPGTERIIIHFQRSIQKRISLVHPGLSVAFNWSRIRLEVAPVVPIMPVVPIVPATVTPTTVAPAGMPVVPTIPGMPIVPISPPHWLDTVRRGVARADFCSWTLTELLLNLLNSNLQLFGSFRFGRS